MQDVIDASHCVRTKQRVKLSADGAAFKRMKEKVEVQKVCKQHEGAATLFFLLFI